MKFPSKAYYNSHMAKHANTYQYACRKCEAKFRYQSNYIAHSRNCERTIDFVCGVCSKSFTSKKAVNEHMEGKH